MSWDNPSKESEPTWSARPEQYLETADVWTVLDLIVAEFTSDPTSRQCFDSRLVERAIRLNREHRDER